MSSPLEDLEHLRGTNPKSYINTGTQITPRIESLMFFLVEQGAASFDQVQRFLGLSSPEPHKMKQPGILTAEKTRKILRPLIKEEELLEYKVFYHRQKGWLWLTRKGYKALDSDLRFYEPVPASLAHLYAVNNLRLLITQRRPHDTWRSERILRAEQIARTQGSKLAHVPDAEFINAQKGVIALECELTVKSEKRLEEIVFDLAANRRYSTIWYFLPPQVKNAVERAIQKLPAEHQKRFALYTLKGELYTA